MAEISGNGYDYQEVRKLEGALRDVGLSRSNAVTAIAAFKKYRQRDADEVSKLVKETPEETQSPFSVKRDWGLTFVAPITFIVATAINIYFAYKRGDTEEAKYLWTAIGICFEASAFFLLQRSKYLWETSHRGIAFIAFVLCVFCLCYNVPNTYGFLAGSLGEKATEKEERISPEVALLQRKLSAATKGKEAECAKRGDLCRAKEKEERDAFNELQLAMGTVKTEARATNHITPLWLWLIAFMLQSSPIMLLIAGKRK